MKKKYFLKWVILLVVWGIIPIAGAEIKSLPPIFKSSHQMKANRLIILIRQAITDFRLTLPANHNAIFYLEQLKTIPQTQKISQELLNDVVEKYFKMIRNNVEKNNLIKSKNQLKAVYQIIEDHQLNTYIEQFIALKQQYEQIQKRMEITDSLIVDTTSEALPVETVLQVGASENQDSVQKRDTPYLIPETNKTFSNEKNIELSVVSKNDRPEMVKIALEPGLFLMGSPILETGHEKNEKQKQIPVPAPYALGVYEVTVGEFNKFINATSYKGDGHFAWRSVDFEQTDEHPVVNVSYFDIQAYLKWLNKKSPTMNYRLPTESEWEYAARAGSQHSRFWGNQASDACQFANGLDLSASSSDIVLPCKDNVQFTTSVNDPQFKANGFGLMHMLGNVREWTCSSYGKTYKGQEQVCHLASDTLMVIRGGSWNDGANKLRSADRNVEFPNTRNTMTGFRLARSL